MQALIIRQLNFKASRKALALVGIDGAWEFGCRYHKGHCKGLSYRTISVETGRREYVYPTGGYGIVDIMMFVMRLTSVSRITWTPAVVFRLSAADDLHLHLNPKT